MAANKANGAIVGSSFVKANQPGLGGHVANAAFMVAATESGHGVGRALAEHAIEWARTANFSAMQFNFVVSTNSRAIVLWKKLGFSIVGILPQAFQHQGLGRPEVVTQAFMAVRRGGKAVVVGVPRFRYVLETPLTVSVNLIRYSKLVRPP